MYLDDILIFSHTPTEHTCHIHQVLQWLVENHLFVNVEKCEFHVHSVTFLGYIIGSAWVKANPKKIQAMAEWTRPTILKQL